LRLHVLRLLFLLLLGSLLIVAACAAVLGYGDEARLDAHAGDAACPDDCGAAPADAGADAADALPGYREVVMRDRPIGYWRLGDDGGAVAADESGHSASLVVGPGVTWGASGALRGDRDTAIHLDGTAVLVAGPAFDFSDNRAFSLEAWISPETVDLTALNYVFQAEVFPLDGGPREGEGIYFNQDQGIHFFRLSPGGEVHAHTPIVPATTRYTHLLASYDGTTLSLFVSGVPVDARQDRGVRFEKASMTVGGAFTGFLDEVAIYDHALGSDRAAAHYEAAQR
jgi:Concanavalin A-like lectin/glucanases superfamily